MSSPDNQCSVCLMDYTDTGDNIPRFLPCHHTLCQSCIKQLLETVSGESFDCPECRRKCEAKKGLETFPPNKYIIQQISHRRPTSQLPKCEKHDNRIWLHCINCQKDICPECLSDDHRKHDVVDINHLKKEKYDEFVKSIESLREKMKKYVEKLKEAKDNINTNTENCIEKITAQKEEVVKLFNDWVKEATTQKGKTVNELDELISEFDKNVKLLNELEEGVDEQTATLETLANKMDNQQKISENKEETLSGMRSLTYTGYNTLETETMQQLRDHLPLLSISLTLSSSNNENETSSILSCISTSSTSSLDTQESPSMSMFSDTPSKRNYQNAYLVDPNPYRTGIVSPETHFTSSYRARSLTSSLESPLCRDRTERYGIKATIYSPTIFPSSSRVTKLASENKKSYSSRPVSPSDLYEKYPRSLQERPSSSSYQQNTIESINQGDKSKRQGLRFTDAARKSTSPSSGRNYQKANPVNAYRTGSVSPETPFTSSYRARSLTSSLESPLCREKTGRYGIKATIYSPSNSPSWSRVTKLASENKKSYSSRPVSPSDLYEKYPRSLQERPSSSSHQQNTIESINQGDKSKRQGLRFTDAARKSTSAPSGSNCQEANPVNSFSNPTNSSSSNCSYFCVLF